MKALPPVPLYCFYAVCGVKVNEGRTERAFGNRHFDAHSTSDIEYALRLSVLEIVEAFHSSSYSEEVTVVAARLELITRKMQSQGCRLCQDMFRQDYSE